MKLRTRLALVIVLFISAFVACFTLMMLLEVPDRAEAETRGALPLLVDLLPGQVDSSARGVGVAIERLAHQVRGMHSLRHVSVVLHAPDGQVLAVSPRRPRELPNWLYARLSQPYEVIRKDVYSGGHLIAYYEASSSSADELTELWEDFRRNTLLFVALALGAMVLILWYTFRTLHPLDRIRHALASLETGDETTRLPSFGTPEMDQIATSFNSMADALDLANADRQALLRRLIDVEEETRRSVAHDLHDELGPYLIALQPLTRTIQRECASQPALATVSPLVDTMIDHQTLILARLRSILTGLHPPELETLGLRRAIERIAFEEGGRSDPPGSVHFDPGGDWQTFGPILDVSIYRLVTECLTNARRHGSGGDLAITFQPDLSLHGRPALGLIVTSASQGDSADADTGSGLGIIGMRDRCLALGGQFRAGPDGPDHWKVEILLPLDRKPTGPYASRDTP